MGTSRAAANGMGLLALSLALSCGGSSDPTPEARDVFQVAFHNRCAETIWPAWGPSGGHDSTVADPRLWAPIAAGHDHVVTMDYGGTGEVAYWGRTGCSFDGQGNGSCETGDCGAAVCSVHVNYFPADATIYDRYFGFRGGYNVAMRVENPGDTRECKVDLATCTPDAGTMGADGGVDCADACFASCCHEYSDGYGSPADIAITFCP